VLKLVAHRGWSAGPEENTPAAFARAAGEPGLAGVEFDVRRSRAGRLIVAHDPPGAGDDGFALEAALSLLARTKLELLVELKEPGIAPAVLDALAAAGLTGRSLVFAFPEPARSFPWADRRGARLGVIIPFPWQAPRLVRAYRPDAVLLGWDERPWTRMAFRAWWSAFSLTRLGEGSSATVVVGVVQRERDLEWLRRRGVDIAVADMDPLRGA